MAGAMTVLLRDAIKPNLLQTLEGGPAFVHAGPFANIAHGNNSIIADRLALVTNDIVCTEAGFGADMGAEKFFDIKCRASGLSAGCGRRGRHGPGAQDARRRRQDRGRQAARPGAPRGERRGGPARCRRTSRKQIENVTIFGIPAVVAINSFPTDTPAEVEAIREVALAAGARDAVVATHFVDGGKGATALAEAVWAATEDGGAGLRAALPGRDAARRTRSRRSSRGSTAPTASSTCRRPASRSSSSRTSATATCRSAWPRPSTRSATMRALKGRPTGFTVPIREVRLSAGAGFVTPLCGEMRTMPGLPSKPGGENIDIDADGNVVGLF